jgi:flagellar biosynthesis component FlhA
MSTLSFLYSAFYTIIIGAVFIYLFIFAYDLFYGEKREKQSKKIHKYFKNETIQKIDMLEHQPRKFTMYQVTTNNGTKKIKLKPGYKVVKMVSKKNDSK